MKIGVGLSEEVLSNIQTVEKMTNRLIQADEYYKDARRSIPQFPDLNIVVTIDLSATIIVYVQYLDSLAQLKPVLTWFAKNGYHQTKEHKPKNYPDSKERRYFVRKEKTFITVCAGFTKENATCRYVKVGTKEIDVMELRCEGDGKEI